MPRMEKLFEHIWNKRRNISGKRHETKKVNQPRRMELYKDIKLTDEQKKEIDKLWEDNYGKKIPYNWHRLYQSYTGNYDVNYFPELFFIPEFQLKMNPRDYSNVLGDKNLLPLLTEGTNIKIPKLIVTNVEGIYRDSKNNLISKKEAINIIKDYKEDLFIKPSTGTSSGKGCKVINFYKEQENIKINKVCSLLAEYKYNFSIQERLINSKLLRKLHPSSINTFRVMTYIFKNKIYHMPVIIRIGQGGNNVDNAHAGGMFIGIKDSGELCDRAFLEFGESYTEHPDSKIKFEDYKIKDIKKIIESAKILHSKIPQLRLISWDLTLDSEEEVVLIELNLRGQSIWLPQIAHGCGAFGENTKDILKWMRQKKKGEEVCTK